MAKAIVFFDEVKKFTYYDAKGKFMLYIASVCMRIT